MSNKKNKKKLKAFKRKQAENFHLNPDYSEAIELLASRDDRDHITAFNLLVKLSQGNDKEMKEEANKWLGILYFYGWGCLREKAFGLNLYLDSLRAFYRRLGLDVDMADIDERYIEMHRKYETDKKDFNSGARTKQDIADDDGVECLHQVALLRNALEEEQAAEAKEECQIMEQKIIERVVRDNAVAFQRNIKELTKKGEMILFSKGKIDKAKKLVFNNFKDGYSSYKLFLIGGPLEAGLKEGSLEKGADIEFWNLDRYTEYILYLIK